MKKFSEELPSVSPEAYLNRQLHPMPAKGQNMLWSETAYLGRQAQAQLDEIINEPNNIVDIATRITVDIQSKIDMGNLAVQQLWSKNLRLVDYFIDEEKSRVGMSYPATKPVINLRRFISEAIQMHPTLDIEDVRQVGRIGLFSAIERHDSERGALATISFLYVRRYVERLFMNHGQTIRIKCVTGSKNKNENNLVDKRLFAYQSRFEGGFSDKFADFCDHPYYIQTNTTPALVEPDTEGTYMDDDYAERYLPQAELTLQPSNDQVDSTTEDQFDNAEWRAMTPILEELLGLLSNRNRQIISERYGLVDNCPKTLEAVGKNHNLTHERIRQIQAAAFSIMRKHIQDYPELMDAVL